MRHTAEVIPLPQTSFSRKMPRKPKNKDVRTREYLTEKEVDQLMVAAKSIGRHGHRDATMILIAYRHGLRVSELIALRWDQLDLSKGRIDIVVNTDGQHPQLSHFRLWVFPVSW